MSLKDQLTADLKDAMKSGDTLKKTVVRGARAAIKESEQRKREDLVKKALNKHNVERPHKVSDEEAMAAYNTAVEAAIEALVEERGVAVESVTVIDVTAVEWRNSCLGCEKPNQQCLMVITPGYRITLKSGAETYTLHTDRTGQQAIICTQPSLTSPRSDS